MTPLAERPTQAGSVRYVGFVRNVMIGREDLTKERLLDIARESGANKPSSYRGTGNVAFGADPSDVDDVTSRIEHGIADVIGRFEPVFARTLDHLRSAVAADPFSRAPITDVHERCVTYLQSPARCLDPLPVHSRRDDLVIFDEAVLDVYSVTRLVDGRATSPGPTLERASDAPVTSRNWSTIEYILTKEHPDERTPQWT